MKNILLSKTNWFNTLSLILFILALPNFVAVVPERYLPTIGILTAVGNYILRTYFTSQPITQFAADRSEPAQVPPTTPVV